MASDKQITNGDASGMKQKVIVVALILIVAFLGWQVKSMLFGGGDSSTPAPKPATTASSKMMTNAAPQAGQIAAGSPTVNGQPAMPQAVTLPTAAALPPQSENELLRLQRETQSKLLESLNTLQMLKVQRDIAEMSQAIAAAKLATVTAEKNISDLLTKPAAPQVPISAYTEKLGVSAPVGGPTEAGAPSTTPTVSAASYVLLSVSMQFDKWSAVLGYQGKLLNVSVGDVLPTDGSVVTAINKDSITLEKDGKKAKLSLVSSI